MDDHGRVDESGSEPAEEDPGWPVGFLVISGLAALYIVVRLVQLGARLVDWLF